MSLTAQHVYMPTMPASATQLLDTLTQQVVIDHYTKYIFADQEFNDYLWVVGGYETKDVNTTEFVYDNKKAVAGPTLPFIVAHHCMVQVSDNAIYIIGGKVDGEISNQGYIYQVFSNHQIYSLSYIYFLVCKLYFLVA